MCACVFAHLKLKWLPRELEPRRGRRQNVRAEKEIVEKREIGRDSGRDEIPDSVQLIHPSV